MAQYSAEDGLPNDWHLVHLGARATGGAGLVFTEMTCVSPEGRISPGCTGLWNDAQRDAWRRIVDFVHAHSRAKLCLQLGHSGRKGSTQLGWEEEDQPLPAGNWPTLAPSPLPYLEGISAPPREMTRADMDAVHRAVRDEARAMAAKPASTCSNCTWRTATCSRASSRRSRTGARTPTAAASGIACASRSKCSPPCAPPGRTVPLSVRLSSSDWAAGGLSEDELIVAARAMKAEGADLLDLSSGQTVPWQKPVYGRMWQTPFSDLVRNVVGIPTIAVGNIFEADHANTIVAAGPRRPLRARAPAPRRPGLDAARRGGAALAGTVVAAAVPLGEAPARAQPRARRADDGSRLDDGECTTAGRPARPRHRRRARHRRRDRRGARGRGRARDAPRPHGGRARACRCAHAGRDGRHRGRDRCCGRSSAPSARRAGPPARSRSSSTTPGLAKSRAIAKSDAAFWRDVLAVNLDGAYHCTRAALPAMLAANWGRIVNVASTAGLRGYAYCTAYCAAKHGVVGLTRALALEVAKTGITVNAVCPGYTDTGVVRDAIRNISEKTARSEADARESLVSFNPQQRLVQPEEVANAVLWLCLPGSESMNGQSLAIAGGEVT